MSFWVLNIVLTFIANLRYLFKQNLFIFRFVYHNLLMCALWIVKNSFYVRKTTPLSSTTLIIPFNIPDRSWEELILDPLFFLLFLIVPSLCTGGLSLKYVPVTMCYHFGACFDVGSIPFILTEQLKQFIR